MNRSHLVVALVAILLAGCSSLPQKSDFPHYDRVDNAPIVFVHGLFGSKLRDKETGMEVWPGSLYKLFTKPFSFLGFKIGDDLKPDLGPYEAFATYPGFRKKRFNQTWKLLQEVGGYQRGYVGTTYEPNDARYYFFVYDWRKDLVASAAELDLFIERIRISHQTPDLKVNIVAQSLGGQLVRYYLAYGSEDVINSGDKTTPTYAGKKKTQKVIYMAAPLEGTLRALKATVEGYKMGFARASQEKVSTVASLYQIFPAPGAPWVIDEFGNDLRIDLYDIAVWKEYGWGIFSEKSKKKFSKEKRMVYYYLLADYVKYKLERARLFHEALQGYTGEDEYIIYSNCKPTLDRAILNRNGKLYFHSAIESFSELTEIVISPGDKIVVYQEFENLEMVIVCSTHNGIWNNPNVTKALIHILLGN